MKIDQNIIEILAKGRVENNLYYLPSGQLDRKIYVKVNDALTSIGLVWNKKQKAHVSDTDIEEKLEEIINTGEYNSLKEKKNELNYFPTPQKIAAQMVDMAKIGGIHEVLEPSCGRGAIVSEIIKKTHCYITEIDKENYEYTLKSYNCVGLFENGNVDFLSLFPNPLMDRIVMNPPFSKGREIKHILHAWKFLKPGGILVSIVSESPFFRENSASREFRNWILENNGETIKLPNGAFKESGTMVNTRILKVEKP